MKTRNSQTAAVLVAAVVFSSIQCNGSTLTWNGSISSDWFNPNNWTPNGVPTSGDIINFDSGTISAATPATIDGQLNWSGGTLAGRFIIAPTGMLNISGGAQKKLLGVVTNFGATVWAGSGIIELAGGGGGTFYNQTGAIFDIQTDQNLGGTGGPFYNRGSFLKSAGTGTTVISATFYNSGSVSNLTGGMSFQAGGTLDGYFRAPGGSISFDAGQFTLDTMPDWTGSVQFTSGAAIAFTVPISGFTLAAGNLIGNNSISGTMDWTGGRISGGLMIPAGTTLSISGPNQKNMLGSITNWGTTVWSGAGLIEFGGGGGGSFYNQQGSLFDVQTDSNLGGTGGPFYNAGILRKTAGNGTTTLPVTLYNTGDVSDQTGTLSLIAGGTLDGSFSAAAGAGINFASGTFTLDAIPVWSGAVQFTSGAAIHFTVPIGNFTHAAGNLVGNNSVGGVMNWSGGRILGTLTVPSGATLNLLGASQKGLLGSLTNWGTTTWSGAGSFDFGGAGGGVFYNQPGGVFDVQNDQTLEGGPFYNAGMFRKSAGLGSSLISVTFYNSGGVNVGVGGLSFAPGSSSTGGSMAAMHATTITFRGPAQFNGNDALTVQQGALFATTGNLLGGTKAASTFAPLGNITFNGAGSAGSPQLLEAMSQDFGATAAGLAHNFAYGNISLGNNTYVKLVDQSLNTSSATPESLYVNSVQVPSGCTLDLNGLHLYVRAAQTSGTLTGGSISFIPGGGALALGVPTDSHLSTGGQDEWTFFARAQQRIVVVIDSTSSAVLPPRLSFAEVQLLDPAGNILAHSNDGGGGLPFALPSVALLTDGTYRIRVHASSDDRNASGNYAIAVWNATLNSFPLVLNQQATGRIPTPFSEDDWSFSASAGQQVRFHLVSVSGAGLAFDLKGPNGWIGFSNLTADSDLMSLPSAGTYTLVSHSTGGGYDLAYAFQMQQTAQASVAVGSTYTGAFSGATQPQLLAITVTTGGPLQINLANNGAGNVTELYAKLNSPPTRGDFDYRAANPSSGSQQILIPFAPPGIWYILVYGATILTPGNYSVTVLGNSTVLTSILPNRSAVNVGFTMTLSGAGYVAGTSVALVDGNNTAYSASSVSVDSFTQLTATFAANLASAGVYSVRVTTASGSATLPNAFTLTGTGAAQLETKLFMPASLGRHQVATLYLEYANTGDAAMPAPLLMVSLSPEGGTDKPILTLDSTRIVQNYWSAGLPPGTAHQVYILASGAQPGLLNPGERLQVPIYWIGFQQPWDFSRTVIQMLISSWTADDTTPFDWASRQESLRPPTLDSNTWYIVYQNATANVTTSGAYVRMLNDNAQYLSRLGERITDVDKLWRFRVLQAYGLSPIRVLDSAIDASMPSPGLHLSLSRQFSSNLRARNSKGIFGQGWYTPWQVSLRFGGTVGLTAPDTVYVVGEAGSARVFTIDSRTQNSLAGTYFSQPGDSSQLTTDGTFYLRDPNGTTTVFTGSGQLWYVEDRNHNRITASFDGSGNLTGLTHTCGSSISLTYNPAGLVSMVSDSAGRFVTYEYDASHTYLLSASTDDGKTVFYTYETSGTPAQNNVLSSVTRAGIVRYFDYDNNGRLASTYLTAGDQAISFEYGTAGDISVIDALGRTRLGFDYRGLLLKVTDPLGRITSARFDDNLRLVQRTAPTGESKHYAWCGCGALTSVTDELGLATRFTYDATFKRLTSFTDPRGNAVSYSHDPQGNVLSVNYPNNSESILGNYTPSGLPQLSINRRKQSVSYTYAASGQLSRLTFADGSYQQLSYDARGNFRTLTRHPASGTEKTTQYAYDYAADGDRLRKVTYANGDWVEFLYDSYGRRQRMTDSAGGDTRYEHDAVGRLSRLRDTTNALLVEYIYNTAGRVQRVNKGNGTYTLFDYDVAGEVLHVINYAPDNSVNSRFDYTYDSRRRRVTMQALDGDWTYAYDGVGQLIHAAFTSSSPSLTDHDIRYNYDAAGNRTSTVIDGVETMYVADNLNQYTSVGGAVLRYDPDGNCTFDGVNSYAYDARNRLVGITGPDSTFTCEYDVLGNLAAINSIGARTDFLLDPTGLVNVIAQRDGERNVTGRNVFGLGLVASTLGGSSLKYFDFDTLGSTASVTSMNGTRLNTYSYFPFGELLASSELSPNAFRFIGQFGVMDAGTPLLFMRYRSYDARTGTFASQDPLGLAAGDTNLRRYVKNRPTQLIDPLGLCATWWEKTTAAVTIGLGGSLALAGAVVAAPEVIAAGEATVIGGALVEGAASLAGAGETGSLPDPGILTGAISGATEVFNSAIETLGDEPCNDDDPDPTPPCSPMPGTVNGDCGPDPEDPPPASPQPPDPPPQNPPDGPMCPPAAPEDPNHLLGPSGYAMRNYLIDPNLFAYTIIFQNETNATAPAQAVEARNPLSTNLDWQTFALTEIAFGDQHISAPANSQYFRTTVPFSYNGEDFDVEIEVGINLRTGEVFANFASIDPDTSLPPSVEAGFLPPEDGMGRGTAHISYIIRPKQNLPTGTEIRNIAYIQFDQEPVISTDQADPHDPSKGVDASKQALVTIDTARPSSTVLALPAVCSTAAFNVSWSGVDVGSGIASYDIFVSTNNGPWTLWLVGATNTSQTFQGAGGNTYSFYSVAHDGVGNIEAATRAVQAGTVAVFVPPPILTASLNPTNGQVLFTIADVGPLRILLQVSTNLTEWTPIYTNILTTTPLAFADPESGTPKSRFYRAIASPGFSVPAGVAPYGLSGPASQAAAAGSAVTLGVSAFGSAPFVYQWFFDGNPLSGAQAEPNLLLGNVQTNAAGDYFALVSNPYGAATSQVATLTVYVPPVITSQPANQTATVGSSASFSVTAAGTPSPDYHWLFNGTNLPGAVGATLILSNVTPANAGTYSVLVSNLYGGVLSSNALLTLIYPWAGLLDTNLILNPGAEAGPGSPSGNDVEPVPGWATTGNFTVAQYGSSFGFPASQPGPPDRGANLFAGGPNTPLSHATQVVDISAAASLVDSGQVGVELSGWLGGGGDSDNAAFSAAFLDASSNALNQVAIEPVLGSDRNFVTELLFRATTNTLPAGTRQVRLTLTMTRSQGSYDDGYADSLSLVLRASPRITTQPLAQSVSAGKDATFTVAAVGVPPLFYQWSLNGTNVTTATNTALTLSNVTVSNAGAYSVLVTNGFGSALSADAVLSVVDSFADSLASMLNPSPWQLISNTALYTVSVTPTGLSISKPAGGTYSLQYAGVQFGPVLHGDFDVAVDFTNASITRVDGSPGNQIQLIASFGGQDFLMVRSDEACCGNNVHVWLYPQASFVGTRTYSGSSGRLHIKRAGSHAQGYVNGTLIYEGNFNTGDATIQLTLQNNGTRDATAVIFANFSVNASSIPGIQPYAEEPRILAQPGSQSVPAGSTAVFTVSATGPGPLSYQWRFEGTNLPSATNAILSLSNLTSVTAGTYAVLVSNPFGSALSSSAVLSVLPIAHWNFNGSLAAATGQPDLGPDFASPATEAGLSFADATIGGQTAQVAAFTRGTYFRAQHQLGTNGGGSYLNQYTLLMDVMFPSYPGYVALMSTHTNNNTDADWFIRPDGAVGISGVYGGNVAAGSWNRLVLVVDSDAGTLTSYVNGSQVQQISGVTRDGRWALASVVLLFADQTSENAAGFVNSVQLRPQAMSAAQIGAMGGPTAAGIAIAAPSP